MVPVSKKLNILLVVYGFIQRFSNGSTPGQVRALTVQFFTDWYRNRNLVSNHKPLARLLVRF